MARPEVDRTGPSMESAERDFRKAITVIKAVSSIFGARLAPVVADIEPAGGEVIARPNLQALYRLWSERRAGRPAPSRDDFSVEDLRPWLGHLLLLDRIDGDDFRYRLYGSSLVEIFGFDLTGRTVTAAAPLIGVSPLAEYRSVIAAGRPFHVSRASPSAREHLLMDKLALPLMDSGRITKILGAIYLSE